MNEYTQYHPAYTDHGVELLGLGPWRVCPLVCFSELPAVNGVYLYVNGSPVVEEHEEILYVGIAPKTFRDRWQEPEAFGRGGHHVVWRLWTKDPVEMCDAMSEETYVVYCELPDCPVKGLERIEECLIDLFTPLNRRKSPLQPFKIAAKYVCEFAQQHVWTAE